MSPKRSARTKRDAEIAKKLALARARGTPWIPDEKKVNRKSVRDEAAKAGLVAEDEEGMIGRPKER